MIHFGSFLEYITVSERKYCINCYFYTLIDLPMWELGCGSWDVRVGIWDVGSGSWDLGVGIWDVGVEL